MPSSPRVRSLAILAAASLMSVAGPIIEPASASVSGRYEHEVTVRTNAERSIRQLHVVKKSTCLDRYAEAQARKMAKAERMYHQDLGTILTKCHLREVGENVAYGYTSGKAVTAAWMHSPGHQANLLNPAHRLIGVGAYTDSRGEFFVSQVFGRSR
jgi:uncharacterized protein YkwD